MPTITDSDEDLKARFKASQKIALKGELDCEMSTWISRPRGQKVHRVFIIPYSVHLALRKRQSIQRVIIHNVGAYAKEEALTASPKLRGKFAVLGAECDSLLQTEKYTYDKTMNLSSDDFNTADILATHYLPNLMNGNNVLAGAAHIGKDKFPDNDFTDYLLPFLAKVTLEPNECRTRKQCFCAMIRCD